MIIKNKLNRKKKKDKESRISWKISKNNWKKRDKRY